MRHSNCYYVQYKMHSAGEVKGICVIAYSKEDAYDKAVFEMIPHENVEGHLPYSAWVKSVTYNNGRYIRFNTFEGKPY